MPSATVRAATAADIAAITDIYRQAVLHGTASFEIEAPDEAEMASRFRSITGGGYPYFVAELDGAVVGYAYASAYRARPGYRFTVEDSIYLTPAAQGKGIGASLLSELVDAATANGYRLMVAVIGDSANFGSIALHRKLGFRFCGTMHSIGYKFGRWLDSVVMELPLGEGDTSHPPDR
jgi:L-amino acid N-acyltransferase YncA